MCCVKLPPKNAGNGILGTVDFLGGHAAEHARCFSRLRCSFCLELVQTRRLSSCENPI